MELRDLVDLMIRDNAFTRILNDPLAQFGPPNRHYLGAELLPEVMKPLNTYKETLIKYRSHVANAGTRYSQPSIKGNALVGSVMVDLGNSDAASEFSADAYDALIEILKTLPDNVKSISEVPPGAMAELIKWADITLNVPLVEFNEMTRWQALVNGIVNLEGDNGFQETVQYYQAAGHRVSAGGDWTNDDYDPIPDIAAGYRMLISKEYSPKRLIGSLAVRDTLLANKQVRQRLGSLSLISGTVVGLPATAQMDVLNNYLKTIGVPAIETYDLQYRISTGTIRFLPQGTLVMTGATGEDKQLQLDRGDQQPLFVRDTIGYTAIGRAANRATPGRAQLVEYQDGKGSPVKGTAWQTSLPVITDPEGVYVINNITTIATG